MGLTVVGTGFWKFATPITPFAALIPCAGKVSLGPLYVTKNPVQSYQSPTARQPAGTVTA